LVAFSRLTSLDLRMTNVASIKELPIALPHLTYFNLRYTLLAVTMTTATTLTLADKQELARRYPRARLVLGAQPFSTSGDDRKFSLCIDDVVDARDQHGEWYQ